MCASLVGQLWTNSRTRGNFTTRWLMSNYASLENLAPSLKLVFITAAASFMNSRASQAYGMRHVLRKCLLGLSNYRIEPAREE